jgi:ABC-type transport system involved in multi-copper enzyme maturation permease subunit
VSAETHLEVYRPFRGKLSEHPVRFWPLWTSGLATALKQRRALFLLYLPPLIGTVVVSLFVYLRFSAESMIGQAQSEEMDFGERLKLTMAQAQAERLFGVVSLILWFSKGIGLFSILIVAWFASGLFCEDRKAGAHQLYFARPLTRLDYALGKFALAGTFAVFAMMVPLFVICLMAAIFSPEWSFLKEEWDVVFRALGFSLVWTIVLSSLVLMASSLASRKSFALVGFFGFVVLSLPVAGILGEFVNENLFAVALFVDLDVLAQWFFGRVEGQGNENIDPASAWVAVGVLVALCWSVIWLRLRRLEVVA